MSVRRARCTKRSTATSPDRRCSHRLRSLSQRPSGTCCTSTAAVAHSRPVSPMRRAAAVSSPPRTRVRRPQALWIGSMCRASPPHELLHSRRNVYPTSADDRENLWGADKYPMAADLAPFTGTTSGSLNFPDALPTNPALTSWSTTALTLPRKFGGRPLSSEDSLRPEPDCA